MTAQMSTGAAEWKPGGESAARGPIAGPPATGPPHRRGPKNLTGSVFPVTARYGDLPARPAETASTSAQHCRWPPRCGMDTGPSRRARADCPGPPSSHRSPLAPAIGYPFLPPPFVSRSIVMFRNVPSLKFTVMPYSVSPPAFSVKWNASRSVTLGSSVLAPTSANQGVAS